MSFFFGANSRYSLYLLWRTPPQKDAATIGARAKRSWELFIIKQNLNNLFYFVNLPHN